MANQIQQIRLGLQQILNGDVEKRIALTVHQQIAQRIFDRGEDKNGAQIGEYSKGYIKRRMKKGLGSNKKVVLEFTGQMRNGFQIIEQEGKLGSGFPNAKNIDKSFWVESTYNKEIFSASKDEQQLFQELLDSEINNLLN